MKEKSHRVRIAQKTFEALRFISDSLEEPIVTNEYIKLRNALVSLIEAQSLLVDLLLEYKEDIGFMNACESLMEGEN